MDQIFHRDILDRLEKVLDRREIIAIKGPRQSGKTTLLKILMDYLIKAKGVDKRNIIFITLEDRDILDKLEESPKQYLRSLITLDNQSKRLYFFIDEFQYLSAGGQKLKLLYDVYDNIKFIITGSSSLELTDKTAKYLVGRVFDFNLYQLSFKEFLRVKSNQFFNVYTRSAPKIQKFITQGEDFNLDDEKFFDDFNACFEKYAG